MELPAPFVQRLARIVPPRCLEPVLASFSLGRPTVFWLNPLRGDSRGVLGSLGALGIDAVPLAWHPAGYVAPPQQRHTLTHSAAASGTLYPLSLSSLLPVPLLDPRPGECVLDLAAAPGGKTVQIAAAMENTGTLSAVEPVRRRFHRLKANLIRCGVTNARLYLKDGRRVGRLVPGRFDRVLLDAPCASEARFRAGAPSTWAHWSERKLRETSRKQRGLIRSAVQALRPGGVLVYCTCSFAPEENEAVIDHLLREADGACTVEPVGLPDAVPVQPALRAWSGCSFHPEVARAVRVLPLDGFDGFFLCRIRKLR